MSPFFFLSKYINPEFHFYTETELKSSSKAGLCQPICALTGVNTQWQLSKTGYSFKEIDELNKKNQILKNLKKTNKENRAT